MTNKITLTLAGEKQVQKQLTHVRNKLFEGIKDLQHLQADYYHMLKVAECDHELYHKGGAILSETCCKKCGFCWMD